MTVDPADYPRMRPERVYEIAAAAAGQCRDEALLLASALDDPVAAEAALLDQEAALHRAELADAERHRRRRHEAAQAWSLGVRPVGDVTMEDDTHAS